MCRHVCINWMAYLLCTDVAKNRAVNGQRASARQMGVASLVLSVIGLVVGIICIIIVVIIITQVLPAIVASDSDHHNSSYATTERADDLHTSATV